MSSECEEPGCFYTYPLAMRMSCLLKRRRFRSKPHHPPLASIHRSAPESNPFHHGRSMQLLLSFLQPQARRLGEVFRPTQPTSEASDPGISPPSVYGPGSSRARHLQWRRASGEPSQSLQGRAGMPCPLFGKRARISNSSVSPGAPGVLRPPVAQPYPCIHTTYRGLRSPL